MNKYIILILLSGIIFQACESSEVVEVNIDGKERVVVEGVLYSGKIFNGVKITRTMPLNETYDIKQAEIKDAYAYLLVNNVQVVPLHYTSDGMYSTLHDMKAVSGNSYEFFAYIKNEQVYARTIVPYKPNLISSKYNSAGFIEARVQARSGEAYGAIWVVLTGNTIKGNNFYSIDIPDESTLGPVNTRTTIFDDDYLDPAYSTKRRVQVFAFDKQFAPYFNNSAKNLLAENNVLTGSSGVAWNVKGNNTIGMFIGVAEGGIEGE